MGSPSEELVLNALRTIRDPEIGRDLVELNMVRTIRIKGGDVAVDLVLTSPDCPLAGWIVMNAQRAVSRLHGVHKVEIKLLDERWEGPNQNDWQGWVDGATGRG